MFARVPDAPALGHREMVFVARGAHGEVQNDLVQPV